MSLVHHHLAAERRLWLRENADQVSEINTQVSARAAFDSASLEALRTRVRDLRGRLGAADTWDRILVQLGKEWTGDLGKREDRGGYSAQEGSLVLRSPTTSDWPDILGAVGELERIPGVGVVGFEMSTSGDRAHRSVDLVRITVALHTARPLAAPTSR